MHRNICEAVQKGTGKQSLCSILRPEPAEAPGSRDRAGRAPGLSSIRAAAALGAGRRLRAAAAPCASMPAQQKKLIFCTAGVLSLACALGTAAAVGTQLWVRGSILCSTGALLVNASGPELHKFIGHIQYGLFAGQRVRQCGLGGRPFQFSCEYPRPLSCLHPAGAGGQGCPSLGHRAPQRGNAALRLLCSSGSVTHLIIPIQPG